MKMTSLLDVMESRWGRHHPLITLTNLDEVCKKTACPKNKEFEASMLEVVIEGFAVHKCRNTEFQTTKHFIAQFASLLLLVRRIVFHLATRFPPRTVAGVAYQANREPKHVLQKVFGSWATYHSEFLKGVPLDEFSPTVTADEASSVKNTWVGALSESAQVLVDFSCSCAISAATCVKC